MAREAVSRFAVRVRTVFATLAGGLLLLGAVDAATAHGTTASPSTPRISVRLRRESITTQGQVFVADVLDSQNRAITGADLDIGGLGDDPDLRVRTTDMLPEGQAYRATLDFPADGSWVLVVRVHAPAQLVELFTVDVRGVAETSFVSPSRTAFRALQGDSAMAHGDQAHGDQASLRGVSDPTLGIGVASHKPVGRLDLGGVLAMMAHSFGAVAWLSATLCLAFVGRIGPGADRRRITTKIARHYPLLALGGLALLLATGFTNIDRSSPGLSTPSELLSSSLGRMYLGLFLFKMFLVVGTIITTWKIREMLPTRVSLIRQANLASVGAQANDDIADGTGPALFRLAEVNALFGVAIIGIVALLNQLNHALH